jgi:thiol:disulfide interchange protein
MKTRILSMLGTAALLLAGFCAPAFGADSPAKPSRPAIYDEKADGATQIADALALAKKENKRVLLQFGANWCGWCHKLHKLFESDNSIAKKLEASYVVAMIDVNKGHNQSLVTKYGAEGFGLPFIVILDEDGKHLISQRTGELPSAAKITSWPADLRIFSSIALMSGSSSMTRIRAIGSTSNVPACSKHVNEKLRQRPAQSRGQQHEQGA